MEQPWFPSLRVESTLDVGGPPKPAISTALPADVLHEDLASGWQSGAGAGPRHGRHTPRRGAGYAGVIVPVST